MIKLPQKIFYFTPLKIIFDIYRFMLYEKMLEFIRTAQRFFPTSIPTMFVLFTSCLGGAGLVVRHIPIRALDPHWLPLWVTPNYIKGLMGPTKGRAQPATHYTLGCEEGFNHTNTSSRAIN